MLPIPTAINAPKEEVLRVTLPLFLSAANELAVITAMFQEEGPHDGVSSGQKDDKDWIPAFAEKRPSHWKEMLGGE